jgi:pseudaminic acid biosynthesis-associated methylase
MSGAVNEQIKKWTGQFGSDYTLRNPQTAQDVEKMCLERYGLKRTDMNEEFIGKFDREMTILEAGANVASQLLLLQEMGFKRLYGIEIQDFAVEKAKQHTKNINLIQGNILDIPFRDGFFDMVFTSGVLIHMSPENLPKAMKEMARCSKRYIFGLEYFSETPQEIHYRGNTNLAWKCDFAKTFQQHVPGLKLIKEKRFAYREDKSLVDTMYLFEKRA